MNATLMLRLSLSLSLMLGISTEIFANTVNLSRGDSITLGNTTVTCEASVPSQPVTWCSCETWDLTTNGCWVDRYMDVFQYRLLPNGTEEKNRLTYKFDFVDNFCTLDDPFGPNGPRPADPERCQEKLNSLAACF